MSKYQAGDIIYRVSTTATSQCIVLPSIDFGHLRDIAITRSGKISGFHILPAAIAVVPNATVNLAVGAVPVLEPSGADVTARARVSLHFSSVSTADSDNMASARVEVEYNDSGGVICRANVSQKNFWPRSWNEAEITQAIYQALSGAYAGFQTPPGQIKETTQKGILVEMRLDGTSSRLTSIRTAYPVYQQRAWTSADKP